MITDRSLEGLRAAIQCVVRVSEALFGYLFELTPTGDGILRGAPIYGSVRDESVLEAYYRSIGERARDLARSREDQSILVSPPNDNSQASASWYAVVITQDLGFSAAAVLVYPFYDEAEAVRTLRLAQMLFTTQELR
jgi:hypothetical protein